jgi:hypothetical protein
MRIALQKRKVRAKLRLNVNIFFLGEEIKAQVLFHLRYRNDVIPLNAKRDAAGSVGYQYMTNMYEKRLRRVNDRPTCAT